MTDHIPLIGVALTAGLLATLAYVTIRRGPAPALPADPELLSVSTGRLALLEPAPRRPPERAFTALGDFALKLLTALPAAGQPPEALALSREAFLVVTEDLERFRMLAVACGPPYPLLAALAIDSLEASITLLRPLDRSATPRALRLRPAQILALGIHLEYAHRDLTVLLDATQDRWQGPQWP